MSARRLLTVAVLAAGVLGAPTAANAGVPSAPAAPGHTTVTAAGVTPAGIGGPASVGGPATALHANLVASTQSGIDLCAQVGAAAGFPAGSRLVTAVAVAMAESSCVPSAQGANGPTSGCPGGSVDRGLWQINSCYHAEVSDSCAYDAQCNASAAYTISSGGANWQPWSTYNSGAYRSWLSAAQAAVNRLCATCTTGTVLASPTMNVRSGPHVTSSLAGSAGYGDVVRISCWTYGDYVSQGYWPSSIWDRISDSVTGASGYAADTWIRTTADVRNLAPSC